MYVTFTGTPTEYRTLHYWVERQLGCPSLCANCGTTNAKRFEWANISGEYKKDVSDWERLCVSCHRLKDGTGLCRKGLHKMTGSNVYVHLGSGRRCLECKKQTRKEYYWRNK